MTDRQRSMPSQREVAAVAGVSRATVSAVLNGSADIRLSEATRQRVWAAVEELGFHPNTAARSLRSRRSNVLGLITSEIATTPYAVAIIKGAQDAAIRNGKMLLVLDVDGDAAMMAEAVATLAGWRVEGLAFATDYHREIQPPPGVRGTPVALVNCFATGSSVAPILPDERQGGRLATEVLIEAGHRRIALINGPAGYPASGGRLDGYLQAHRAIGLPVDDKLVRAGDWWQESGLRHANALLDLHDPPTALFCANDWMAMGVYDAIRERGLRIPTDVSVVGFDNRVEIAAHLRPALTTVALPYREMGELAVEQLLGAPHHRLSEPHLVPCPLVRRASVAGLSRS
jgi:LacI family transcriptional regulator